jgi:hypothetical protein
MICRLIEGLLLGGWQLTCPAAPAAVWAYAAGITGIATTVLLAVRARKRALRLRVLTAALFALGFMLLAFATERPELRRALDRMQGGKIVVLLDQSESFWRDPARARASLHLAADRIGDLLAAMPDDQAAEWRGELRGFGRASGALGREGTAAHLAETLRRYQAERLEDASNLRAGLLDGLAALRDAEGQGRVILLSDGLASEAPDDALWAEFRALGIPVDFIASGALTPASGLVAANLGPEHRVGEEALLRGTTLGAGRLVVTQKGRSDTLDVAGSTTLRPLRLTTGFDRRGLQGLQLGFDLAGAQQQRNLFTLIRGPARLLVYGPAPWADALPAARWRIERASPATPLPPADYDLVVIDGLEPQAFPTGHIGDLLAAADGTGLMIINGGLRGSVADEQVISAWNHSVLGPILPVDSDPRLFVQEPPPRDIVVMVDVSGSMSGHRLGSAQSAIRAILAQLRSQDSIAILPFSSDAHTPFQKSAATQATLEAARRYTDGLSAGGGTAPETTLQSSARFVSNYCAFFFISDAEFEPPKSAPQCFTTAISVSDSRFPMDVSAWGEEILLGEDGSADNIPFRYFRPEERKEYYREGPFAPLSVGGGGFPDAGVSVGGMAISYPRSDARVELLHALPPPDPLFAWRRDARRPGVVAGVFLGPMDARWGQAALPATEAMLDRLLGWPDQDRYLVQLLDEGDRYLLRVTPTSTAGVIHQGALSASLNWSDGSSGGISLQFDQRQGGFSGSFSAPAADGFQLGLLILQEGSNIQRIPVDFPPATVISGRRMESLDFGVNAETFRAAEQWTGGTSLAQRQIFAYSSTGIHEVVILAHLFLSLAFALLAAGVWSRSLNS